MHVYSPSYDNKIFKKFSVRTLPSKIENKLALQRELGFVTEPKIPLLCIPGGMSDELGGEQFLAVVDGLLSLDCQIVVRGIGSERYGKIFTHLENDHDHRLRIIRDEEDARRKMYAGSDMSLFFAADEDELLHCLSYGAIPISPVCSFLENYDPVQESGNAFIAEPQNQWGWFAGLVRAMETFRLPYDWRTIQKHAMLTVKELQGGSIDEEDVEEEGEEAV